jgi:MIP family channel proteins
MDNSFRPALAELIGTFTLTFIGAGVGAVAGFNLGGIIAVALAHGIALMCIIYTWGAISGAHVNPAVTFGLALGGHISWGKAVVYWIAQFVGAALASYLLVYILSGVELPTDAAAVVKAAVIGEKHLRPLGQTVGTLTGVSPGRTVLVEAVLTFFLVTAVYSSGAAGRNGNAVGLAIGLVLTMDILMGGALTGASMNPARSFGPALAMNDFGYLWMYFVGPLAGGGVAGLLYNSLFMPERNKT